MHPHSTLSTWLLEQVIRFATAAVVCAVAVFAAVVSYSHIYGLGRAHDQDGTAARLLPPRVDGLILAASPRRRTAHSRTN